MNNALKVRYEALKAEVAGLKQEMKAAPVANLQEKDSDHWPFKRKAHLGPGPKKGHNQRTDDWECVCSDYECDCEDKLTGETKRIKIDKGYKAAYNKLYKQWVAGKISKEGMKKKLAAAKKGKK